MTEIKNKLAINLKKYVEIILEEYGDFIPKERKKFLLSIDDYEQFIEIIDTGTISLLYKENKIYFPKLAFEVISELKKHPMYGTVPNHKCYDESTIIKNNNTFRTYIEHVILTGLTPEQYFQESLLHETMHFCGSRGADPLREGLTELKTRELVKEKNFLTSGCGYPKEIAIVLELQELFGIDTMNKIAFAKDNKMISDILIQDHGIEAQQLYFEVRREMKLEFDNYINQKFDGPTAHEKKAEIYEKIDYTKPRKLLEKYRSNQELGQMLNREKGDNSSEVKNKNI